MERSPSVEFASQVGPDAGRQYQQHRGSNSRHQRQSQQQQVLVRSKSLQYLDQDALAADVLSPEEDLYDQPEEEDTFSDMTPEMNNPHAHRRNSPAECNINKKSNKPMMEKKRRQRINRCLNDLKTLVLEALKRDPAKYSKLEKADILEMTVRHLQMLHRQQSAAGCMMGNGQFIGEDISKYRAGFTQCAAEVTKYLATMNDIPHDLHTKVLTHLNSLATSVAASVNSNATCVQNSVNVMPNPAPIILVVNNATAAAPTAISHVTAQPINFHENTGNSLGPQPNFAVITTSRTQSIPTPIQPYPQSNGLQILPTRLTNGDLALVLPATTTVPLATQNKNIRSSPSAALQASAPVLTAILTSDRNHVTPASTYVQPPALSTSSEDSALGPETLEVSDSDISSGICTPVSSMSTASSPLPAEEAGRMSPKRATTSRSASPLKPQIWNSSCFREELSPAACSSHNAHRQHQMIAPKSSNPRPPKSSSPDIHKRKKANTPPPPEVDSQSMWRPWH
ncbi:protein hairy-like [Macrobrachium rosenbergii]|uniref:protein hairy-like n=1 Tax=Macrobrachium rosenbergii TaxID=79674 RepID=UPI0034D5B2F7